jgi:hypothetical protein
MVIFTPRPFYPRGNNPGTHWIEGHKIQNQSGFCGESRVKETLQELALFLPKQPQIWSKIQEWGNKGVTP